MDSINVDSMELELRLVGQRLKEYLTFKNIKMSEFGRSTRISGAQISNIVHGKNFSIEKLLQITDSYPDLNLLWLLQGKGKMLVIENKNASEQNHLVPKTDQDFNQEKKQQEIVETLKHKIQFLESMINYQGLTIDAYKNSIEVLTSTNKDLKDIVQHYKNITDNKNRNNIDLNNLQSA
ncbi:hypothetical protein [Xanthocytophaga agilis]|uniref:HTH cro/C1-type domain-containing protein n=1 Tax=Xanthocytophaga agilis TaxID=3048010 RepID=A0AAE3R3Y1_9BACT|nr:hypothetical protein [Xanthocytophaga agilis]MDJ1503294.1 hypothetical protein [Xanthocytophaga agilis]